MRKSIMTGFAAAGLATLMVPVAAWAGDEDDARVAIAAARAKLDAGEKAGVGGNAADVQARGRAALDKAMAAFKHDEDRSAVVLAHQADALADLAQATAELRTLETERDKLAAR